MDAWLAVILAAAVLGPIAMAIYDLAGTPDELWTVLPATALPLVIVAWIVCTTDYTFDGDHFLVRSGPFRWKVPLAKIDEVKPSRTLASSPALSLDRLEIRFNRYDAVVISPVRREDFLAELKQRRSRLGVA